MRCLEIGPGSERIEGFETLNIVRTPQTDHVGDARKPPFKDATFDVVYSSHCIEHIDWWDIEATIAQWVRILKPGGLLEVHTVNGLAMVRAIIELEETGESTINVGGWMRALHKGDPYKWAVGRLFNYPKGGNEHHRHRAILTPRYLQRCFEFAGVIDIEPAAEPRGRVKHRSVNMGLRGRKC